MDQKNIKQQIVDRLKQANNVLVTVSANPSVDQLAACIGLSLMLNKLNKHATAVFSGKVPSTIEFLQPEKTLEATTDSLRDFIISLDKSKADKLRYKVEDKLVKIFITPYRTSIDQKDLEFSQGDFNVEVVVAIGVVKRDDLDQAIVSHGRILHDATVISLNKAATGALGSINWQEPAASSLSEMVANLSDSLQIGLDNQIATALLTGIVAETERFRNNKTTPQTMAVSSKLMAAGANQQLIAAKLDEPTDLPEADDQSGKGAKGKKPKPGQDDGALSIDHGATPSKGATDTSSSSAAADEISQIHIDEHGVLQPLGEASHDDDTAIKDLFKEPPKRDEPTPSDQKGDQAAIAPMSLPALQPPEPPPNISEVKSLSPTPPAAGLDEDKTLVDIEQSVHSPHVSQPPAGPGVTPATNTEPNERNAALSDQKEHLNEAREAVDEAIHDAPTKPLEPIEALGAQPIDLNSQVSQVANSLPSSSPFTSPNVPPSPTGLPPNLVPPEPVIPTSPTGSNAPATPPPPVPPPLSPLPSQYMPPAITPTLPTAEEYENQQGEIEV